MKEKLSKIQVEALEQINAPDANLEEIKIKYLGKKGELTAVLRGMGALSPEERPAMGQAINATKAQVEEAIAFAFSGKNGKKAVAVQSLSSLIPFFNPLKTYNISSTSIPRYWLDMESLYADVKNWSLSDY